MTNGTFSWSDSVIWFVWLTTLTLLLLIHTSGSRSDTHQLKSLHSPKTRSHITLTFIYLDINCVIGLHRGCHSVSYRNYPVVTAISEIQNFIYYWSTHVNRRTSLSSQQTPNLNLEILSAVCRLNTKRWISHISSTSTECRPVGSI